MPIHLAKLNSAGLPRVQVDPPEGTKVNLFSINWCDKRTWFPDSQRVEGEEFTPDGSYVVYSPAVSRPWIDVTHGRITDERLLRSEYAPVVKVNGDVKTENSPELTDEDYSVDYQTGDVTFNSALTSGDVVTVDYSYAQTTMYKIVPKEGKVLRITSVELQFSQNVEMLGAIMFQPFGYVQFFAPELCPDPYPPDTLIPLEDATVYQTMMDIINEASEAYPSIPKMGGNSWRGMPDVIHIFRWPWDQRGTTDIYNQYGMEIRIYIENDEEFVGDFAVNTFYGLSQDQE